MHPPRIVVTIGDPAGVGVALKSFADPDLLALAEWSVIGDHIALEAVQPGYRALLAPRVRVISPGLLNPAKPIRFGELSAEYGLAAIEYVRLATEMCLAGAADAMVTAPLNKEAVAMSGRAFSGHTEYIAELCGATESRMLLASEKLATVHVSTHIALEQACRLDKDRIVRTIQLGGESMRLMWQCSEDRCLRPQPARRRAQPLRPRRRRDHRPRNRGGTPPGIRLHRPALTRRNLHPRHPQRIRPHRRHVPRPGPHPDEAHRL